MDALLKSISTALTLMAVGAASAHAKARAEKASVAMSPTPVNSKDSLTGNFVADAMFDPAHPFYGLDDF